MLPAEVMLAIHLEFVQVRDQWWYMIVSMVLGDNNGTAPRIPPVVLTRNGTLARTVNKSEYNRRFKLT